MPGDTLICMPPPKVQQDFELRYDDYLHIVCVKCNESTRITYLGLDPSVPKILVQCPTCKKRAELKLYDAHAFPKLETRN